MHVGDDADHGEWAIEAGNSNALTDRLRRAPVAPRGRLADHYDCRRIPGVGSIEQAAVDLPDVERLEELSRDFGGYGEVFVAACRRRTALD